MVRLRKLKRNLVEILIVLLLVVICVVDLIPLYYMVSASLKTRAEYIRNVVSLPLKPTVDNYVTVLFEFDFPRMFANSLILTVASVAVGVYVSSLAAFAFGKMRFRGRDIIFNLMIPLMAIPAIVMFLPLFVMMKNVGLVDTYPAPILIYVGLIIPFSIFLITSFMSSVPDEILESARIDGASNLGIFHRILIPLLSPAIATAVIVNGMWIWNELLIAFIFLQSDVKKTLVVKLTTLQGLHDMNIPLVMAGATVVSVPIIIAYVLSQRWFIRGLVQGSIK
jgi:ABC-type glycerol-3-phosphate transport system permease component